MKQEVNLENESIENILGKLLCEKNLTISTAESCTGGKVAATLINYPGISNVFLEGAITYSNESKIKRLNVKRETLENYGAVSEQTAYEMAIGICNYSGSRASIATTGIAGPGGGTIDKPIGLVYISVCIDNNVVVKKYNFSGNREEVRNLATQYGLNMLKDEIENIY